MLRSPFEFTVPQSSNPDREYTCAPVFYDGYDYTVSWIADNGVTAKVGYPTIVVEGNLERRAWVCTTLDPALQCSWLASAGFGIAQAPLDKRKVGKVQMHLVDSGFPNAMLALGQVMTWAAENKGYLPHDWVNIPNPEAAFIGAASRHRTLSEIQRTEGLAAKDRVDDESGLLHKSHELFNVLAQLELILRGKIV